MIRIGHLTIFPDRQAVLADDRPIELGSRAFDVLLALAEANGEMVSKKALMDRVWPTTYVTENSLHVQIGAIRRAMGPHRAMLVSIPGRGYRLLHPVHCSAEPAPAANLAAAESQLYGRDASLDEIAAMLHSFGVVTLMGAGGIGKTSLALEVAKRSPFGGNVCVVELARQEVPEAVPAAIAGAMGFTVPCGAAAAQAVIGLMNDEPALLILDNCEHVIEAVADFVSLLAAAKPACKVLATSREALRIPGERVYQVAPLEVPGDDAPEASLAACSSVQLFLARARAYDARFSADAAGLALIGVLCKRLDGIPLAIELAAARASILGVSVLADNIGERLQLLSGGARNALPRHQTLRATFDWSYNLLHAVEQKVLRRLGVLRGEFTLEEACAVAACDDLSDDEITESICALVTKSLLIAHAKHERAGYSLLETTRSYAVQRLEDNGERNATELRRAIYLCRQFRNIRNNWAKNDVDKSLRDIGRRLDNARAALDWAFSPSGNPRLGRELAALFVPRLFDLSLVQECSDRALKALQSIDDATCFERESHTLPLLCAYASGAVYTQGSCTKTLQTWNAILLSSVAAQERWFEARAIWGFWNAQQYGGQPRAALASATRFAEIAARDANEPNRILAQRITAIAEHYCGNHAKALERLEQMLSTYIHPIHRREGIGHGIHHGIVARATLARLLLVQGRVDDARRTAASAFDAAQEYGQAMVTSYVVAEAVLPVSAMTGDLATLRSSLAVLDSLSTRFGFEIWKACGACFSVWAELDEHFEEWRVGPFYEAVAAMLKLDYLAPFTLLHGLMAQTLAAASKYAEALETLTPALLHCEQSGEHWYYPELLRIKGNVLRRAAGSIPSAEAEACLIQAITMARQQHAKLFELRAATDLAELRIAQGRNRDALRALEPACAGFPENQGGSDWTAACRILRTLTGSAQAKSPGHSPKTLQSAPSIRNGMRQKQTTEA